MPVPFNRLREMEDRRVKMRFDDGYEVVARLWSATQDMDGSLHLIYDRVEWENDPADHDVIKDRTCYAPGESLVSIEDAEPANA